jgi:tRNA (cmo5U34)-methyltransferase
MRRNGMPDVSFNSDKFTPTGKWAFDTEVTKCFDDMLSRSIPSYKVMRDLTHTLGLSVLKNLMGPTQQEPQISYNSVLDLGASRGEAIAPFAEDPHIKCYAVEISDPMLDELFTRFTGFSNVEIIQDDLKNSHSLNCPKSIGFPEKYGVILSILTIQFTPIEYRMDIIQSIFDSLPAGGAFIFVEKILGNGSSLNKLMVSNYHDLKHENGYSYESIDRKKASLEGVLVPQTAKANEEMIALAGFRKFDCFYRHLNFAGWICIK